jgi:MFS family permease
MKTPSQISLQQKKSGLARPLLVRLTIAACLLFSVFVFVDSGWGPLLVPLSNQLQTSLSLAGLFYVCWTVGYLPGALIGGAMLDRYGPRRVFFIAALFVFCGLLFIYFGMVLPHAIPLFPLLLLSGMGGIGGGIIDASTNGLISGIYTERRATALNLFNLLYPLGGVIVALTDAGLLKAFHNDPRPSLIFTLCFTVGALISLLGVPKHFRMIEDSTYLTSDKQDEDKNDAFVLVKILLPVILVMMFTSGISSSIRAWTPAYLHVAYAQTPAIAAALSSITWLIAACSRFGAAFLILRIGSWRMVMLGLTITLIGLVAIILSPNAITATLAIAFTSVGLSPIFATCLAIGGERVGRSFGSVTGILLFVSGISTVFSGWFFGFLLNASGPLWPVLYCFAFVVIGGIFALRLRPVQ